MLKFVIAIFAIHLLGMLDAARHDPEMTKILRQYQLTGLLSHNFPYVVIAGEPDVGKTSLIQSMLQVKLPAGSNKY